MYDITSVPYILHNTVSLNKGYHRILLLAINRVLRKNACYNAYSLKESYIFTYRCATSTCMLRNSKVYVEQGTPCRCAAVNNYVMFR